MSLLQVSNKNLVFLHTENWSGAGDLIHIRNLPGPTCVYWTRSKGSLSLCDSNKLARWEMQDAFDLQRQRKGWFIDDVLEVQQPTEVHHISSVCVQQHQSLSLLSGMSPLWINLATRGNGGFSHNKIHWSVMWKHGYRVEAASYCAEKHKISLIVLFLLASKFTFSSSSPHSCSVQLHVSLSLSNSTACDLPRSPSPVALLKLLKDFFFCDLKPFKLLRTFYNPTCNGRVWIWVQIMPLYHLKGVEEHHLPGNLAQSERQAHPGVLSPWPKQSTLPWFHVSSAHPIHQDRQWWGYCSCL